MNILAVDDERHALELLKDAILEVRPDCSLVCVRTSDQALEHVRDNKVDAAFIDIRIDERNGLELAARLKECQREANIIFVTGYDQYMGDAFGMHASGYVHKPVTAAEIARELEDLRYPVKVPDQGIRIQTFGSFEVFVDGRAVDFRRSKSKEILAYLVDRCGAGVSRKDLAAILWEDEPYTRQKQKQLQTLIDEMKRALKDANAAHMVIQGKGRLFLDVSQVDCDYYRFERWDPRAVNSYCGEYMVDYSWAEFTAGALNRKLEYH